MTEVLAHSGEACQLTHKNPMSVMAAQFIALSGAISTDIQCGVRLLYDCFATDMGQSSSGMYYRIHTSTHQQDSYEPIYVYVYILSTAWRVVWKAEDPRVAMVRIDFQTILMEFYIAHVEFRTKTALYFTRKDAAAISIGDKTLSTLIQLAKRKVAEAKGPSTALSRQGEQRVDDLALTSMLQAKWTSGADAWTACALRND